MINEALFPKAYKEVLEILKYIPADEYNKIPKEIIQNMEEKQDNQYQYILTNFENFNEQPMLKETEAILSVFYRDYWATTEERKRITNKEKSEIEVLETEKRQKYNPDDLFNKRISLDNRNTAKELSITEVKESLFNRLKNKIKKFLKILLS